MYLKYSLDLQKGLKSKPFEEFGNFKLHRHLRMVYRYNFFLDLVSILGTCTSERAILNFDSRAQFYRLYMYGESDPTVQGK